VRQLRAFNISLLGNCYRSMFVDKVGLWYKVLASRYGEERRCLREGGRNWSSWWRKILRIRECVSEIGGGWFREHI
jgi:hypothetical protein